MKLGHDSRDPLVGLVDELSRLSGRMKSVFAGVRRSVGLGESEMMVLSAVVAADFPPTVPQIGRSLGHPRQLVQRAANALIGDGLIEDVANPDHKRAVLLVPTDKGRDVKRKADEEADRIASLLSKGLDMAAISEATVALHVIRKQLETRLRMAEAM